MGVTNAGFAELANLGGDVSSPTEFTYLAYGTGTTAFAVTQTALVTESDREAATVSRTTTNVANDTLRLTKTFTISSTLTIAEVGVFNAASGGTMLARTKLTTTRSVVSGDQYVLTYDIVFA